MIVKKTLFVTSLFIFNIIYQQLIHDNAAKVNVIFVLYKFF
jgi:hypothetical protein